MADLALGGLERIVKACLAIKKAVETVKHNKEDCRGIQRCVDRVTGLLSWLQELTRDAVTHPSFSGALDDLADSMEVALELITDCQQKSSVRHLILAGDMAKKLRRVHEDILHKLVPAIFATNILQISVSVTNTLHYVGTHPPLLVQQPQVAGEVNSYDSNLSAIEKRPGVNSNTAMVATGNVVPYASSSRLTEFNSSKWESALHLSSEENITTGGHAFVLKQKIVIKVAMPSVRSRSKAMALVARRVGVQSVAIVGEGKDQVVVVGESVDSVCLINALREKVGSAELLMVGAVLGCRRDPDIRPVAAEHPHPPHSRGIRMLYVDAPPPAALPRQDAGPSSRGITAHLRDAAAGLHEWLVERAMPTHGIIFVLAFLPLLILKIVTSRIF